MNKMIILLLTVTALMQALPVSAQITNALEDTPGTHEYFIKYIDGRQTFTNNQMVGIWTTDSIKGRIVQKIEKGKFFIRFSDTAVSWNLTTYEASAILLTGDDDKYSEGQAISAWALSEGKFTCTDDKGIFSTLAGYRIPIPNAITFEQYQKLFNAGVLTPNKILTIYPRISDKQATAYKKEAWELSTSTNAAVLNGTKAVELALKATAYSSTWVNLNTLAAAYARNGDFKKAIETQQKAIDSALRPYSRGGGKKTQDALQNKLALYKNNQPYTQQPKVKSASSTNKIKSKQPAYVSRRSRREIAERKSIEELAKLSPSELRKHVATLKDEYTATSDAYMVKIREEGETKKQLEISEESEMDKAAIAYHQAKSKRQLALEKLVTTQQASEFALNFYVNSLTNAVPTLQTDTPTKP